MEKLAYHMQQQSITTADYIAWAHRRLALLDESPALFKLAAFNEDANIFEIKSCFEQAMRELQLTLPTLTNDEIIRLLASDVLNTTDAAKMNELARDIFTFVSDAGYPNHLLQWVEVSDMQDRLQYDAVRPLYKERDVLDKIYEAARMTTRKYTCPCCGYKTLDEKPPGTYEICTLCFWEDDPIQFEDPDYEGGANSISLRTAQQNVVRIGVSEECYAGRGDKRPLFEKDTEWSPVCS